MKNCIQSKNIAKFRELHLAPNILFLPNIWDAASAIIAEQVGFTAVGTTSAGLAQSFGYADGEVASDYPKIEGDTGST
jgi:2-methylisocitrate lyase-like PEP mutase family enzyme